MTKKSKWNNAKAEIYKSLVGSGSIVIGNKYLELNPIAFANPDDWEFIQEVVRDE